MNYLKLKNYQTNLKKKKNKDNLKINLNKIEFEWNHVQNNKNQINKNKSIAYSEGIFQLIEIYKKLLLNFYHNYPKIIKKMKKKKINTNSLIDKLIDLDKIKMISNFIYNFKIEYMKQSNDNLLGQLKDYLIYIKPFFWKIKERINKKYKRYESYESRNYSEYGVLNNNSYGINLGKLFKNKNNPFSPKYNPNSTNIEYEYYKVLRIIEKLFKINNKLIINIERRIVDRRKAFRFENGKIYDVTESTDDYNYFKNNKKKKKEENFPQYGISESQFLKLEEGDEVKITDLSPSSVYPYLVMGKKIVNGNVVGNTGYFSVEQLSRKEKLINNNNNVLTEVTYKNVLKKQKHKFVNKNKLNQKIIDELITLQKLLKEESNYQSSRGLNLSYKSFSIQVKKIVEKMKKGNLNKTKIKNIKLIQLLNKIKSEINKSMKKYFDNNEIILLDNINNKVNLVTKILFQYQLI